MRGERLLDGAGDGIAAEPSHRADPCLTVSRGLLGPEVRAGGDQLGQGDDGVELPGRGDPDEPVRVEVVAEQQRRLVVGGREETGAPVVDEVALVDGLEPEREPLRRQRPEDPDPLRLGAQRLAPERALGRRLAASVSQTSVVEEVGNGLHRPVDVGVRVGE